MLLAIDVGNTNTVVGLFDNGTLHSHWRLQTVTERTSDEYGVWFEGLFDASSVTLDEVDGCAISSVVPPVERQLQEWSRNYLGLTPKLVGEDLVSTIDVQIQNPEQIGADRLVNAHGAFERYQQDLIIVDFGTATTFDAVSNEGAYMGGVIAPGVVVSSEALFEAASKLPRVEIAKPDNIIGQNTVEAMQSGLYYGSLGMVEKIIDQVVDEFEQMPVVVATGGLGRNVGPELEAVDKIDEFLTLRGLDDLYHCHIEQ